MDIVGEGSFDSLKKSRVDGGTSGEFIQKNVQIAYADARGTQKVGPERLCFAGR